MVQRGHLQPQSYPPQQKRLSLSHTNGALADESNLISQSVETAADRRLRVFVRSDLIGPLTHSPERRRDPEQEIEFAPGQGPIREQKYPVVG